MDLHLNDKVAIITGSTSGIGKGIARQFALHGVRVVINSNENQGGQETVDEILGLGGEAVFIRADVTDTQQVETMVQNTMDAFGKIDILINNAGINISVNERVPVYGFPDEMWRKILSVDLDGIYHCSKAVAQRMVGQSYGKIINISSVVGAVPLRNQCAFAAAKGAVNNLTKAMALELAPHGINVNAILPGSIQIPVMSAEGGLYKDGRYESIMSSIPFKRPGTPDDIAHGALFLASDISSYITGHLLVIDGGWICGFARDW